MFHIVLHWAIVINKLLNYNSLIFGQCRLSDRHGCHNRCGLSNIFWGQYSTTMLFGIVVDSTRVNTGRDIRHSSPADEASHWSSFTAACSMHCCSKDTWWHSMCCRGKLPLWQESRSCQIDTSTRSQTASSTDKNIHIKLVLQYCSCTKVSIIFLSKKDSSMHDIVWIQLCL